MPTVTDQDPLDVLGEVALPAAALPDDPFHLLRDQLSTPQRGDLIWRRAQQRCEIGGKADGGDDDGAIGRRREDTTIDREGVFHIAAPLHRRRPVRHQVRNVIASHPWSGRGAW